MDVMLILKRSGIWSAKNAQDLWSCNRFLTIFSILPVGNVLTAVKWLLAKNAP